MRRLSERFQSVAAINECNNTDQLRRSYSETNIRITEVDDGSYVSTLLISTSRVNIGEKITVSWNLAQTPTENDRFLLCYKDETSSDNHIASKGRSNGRSKVGQISWLIHKETQLKEDINLCVFKYFHGLVTESQRCIAKSAAFTICRPLSMSPAEATPPMAIPGVDDLLHVYISGAKASNLKKGFFGKPKPSVMINIVPRVRHLAAFQKHHGLQGKASSLNNTVDPLWEDKKFEFTATAADLLEIVVRNKSKARAPVKKFLGKLVFPVSKIIESCGLDTARRITQHLLGRTTADKVQGTFSFTICIKKSLLKAEYTFPRLSKRISASNVSADSTLPLPNAQHDSIINTNGVLNINFSDKVDKQRPHSYHPHLLLEKAHSEHVGGINCHRSQEGHIPFRRSASVPEVEEEEEEEEEEEVVSAIEHVTTSNVNGVGIENDDNVENTNGEVEEHQYAILDPEEDFENEYENINTSEKLPSSSNNIDVGAEGCSDNSNMTSMQSPVPQQQISRTSASKISYEKIANSRFYVKRHSDDAISSSGSSGSSSSSEPVQSTSISSLLNNAFCLPSTTTSVATNLQAVNGHNKNDGNERDIEDANETIELESNGELNDFTSEPLEKGVNDDDDDGYVEVEPEFTQNEAGSCDSSELEESSMDNSASAIFRVNSCQNLLVDNDELSDGDQSPSKVVDSTDAIQLSPFENIKSTASSEVESLTTINETVTAAQPCTPSKDSNSKMHIPLTFQQSQEISNCSNLSVNQNGNLIDLRSPVGTAHRVINNESCGVSSSNSEKTTLFFGTAGSKAESSKNTDVASTNIHQLFSTTCNNTCLACAPIIPPKPIISYPGGARPREPKTNARPASANIALTPTVFSDNSTDQSLWHVSLNTTKNTNDFDRPSKTTNILTSEKNSNILTSEKNNLPINGSHKDFSNIIEPVSSKKLNNSTKSGDSFHQVTSNTLELSESLFTMPLFTSSDIRLPPPRNDNTSLGGIINSSFATSPKATPILNNKDTMPLAQTDYDISTDKPTHSGNKQNLVNIIKNEFPPFTVHSNSSKVSNEEFSSLNNKPVSSTNCDIDPAPKIERLNSLNEMLTFTTTGTTSSTNTSPLSREGRRSMHNKKNRTPRPSESSSNTSNVVNAVVTAMSVSDNLRTPPMPDIPPPLPPKEGSPRVLDTSESTGTPHSASSKSGNLVEGFRQRPGRTSQPNDIINEVLNKGATRGRESIRSRHTPRQAERVNSTTSTSSNSNSNRPAGGEERLPKNWERAVDSHGRVYYIDHNNKTTTWQRPTIGAPTSPEHSLNTQLEQLDRRYQSLRRTLRAGRRAQLQTEETIPENSVPDVSTASASATPPNNSSPNLSSTANAEERLRAVQESPGCLFLLRRDFFQFVSNHNLASQFLHRNPSLNKIVNKVRSDPQQFSRYQHSRDIVTLLNFFASDSITLPPGWEVKNDGYGQSYYVDHNIRATTFIDPRLPLEDTPVRSSRHRDQAPPPTTTSSSQPSNDLQQPISTRRSRRGPQSTPPPPTYAVPASTPNKAEPVPVAVPKTYDEKVVAFIRQDNITEILKRRDGDYDGKTALQRKISIIQRDGVNGLKRYQGDMELVILVSMFEDEIQTYVPKSTANESMSMTRTFSKGSFRVTQSGRSSAPYRRDFEAKIRTFHKQLIHNEYGQGPGKIRLKIRRRHVLQEAFDQIMKQSPRSLHKEKLYIKFTGEEGLDYGGPAREFFFMISRELFNPYYGLFEYSAIDTYTLQVSPASRYVENAHNWFRFSGRIIALSLIHQHLLDVFFTRTIYKALLREPWDLSDVQSLDQVLHQSLTWILENDITDTLDLCFTVSEEVFGDEKVQERDLKPNGMNIPVTEDNKKEYVDLMLKWKIERGMGEQMEQIIRGFGEALDLKMISIFDDRELELVLAGTADIDIKDWRKNTEYRSGYHDKHKVVQWFWKAVDSFTNERRLRLIQFVTGTSSIPYEGFGALRGSTGLKKFTIDCWGSAEMLPRAHTCFNRLDLPPYEEYDTLLDKILYAIEETSTFGIE